MSDSSAFLTQAPVAVAPRILLVDDNRDNREVLTRRLRKHGYDILEAESGKAALALVEADMPDLVLLDHMMPDLSGLETLAILRGHRAPGELPVIMVTAHHSEDMVTAALTNGANDFVTKPISFPLLLTRLQAQLARRTAEMRVAAVEALLDRRMTEKNLEVADLRAELDAERALRAQMAVEIEALRGDIARRA
jgi:DNA-binding response OmpR family regulator